MVKTTVADLIFREIFFSTWTELCQLISCSLKAEHFSNVAETSRALSEKGQFENGAIRRLQQPSYRFSVDRIWTCSAPAHFETLHFQRFSFNLENADAGGIMHKISLGNFWVTKISDVPNFPKEVKIEIFQGSLNYPFSGVQTKHMYGNFEGFPF